MRKRKQRKRTGPARKRRREITEKDRRRTVLETTLLHIWNQDETAGPNEASEAADQARRARAVQARLRELRRKPTNEFFDDIPTYMFFGVAGSIPAVRKRMFVEFDKAIENMPEFEEELLEDNSSPRIALEKTCGEQLKAKFMRRFGKRYAEALAESKQAADNEGLYLFVRVAHRVRFGHPFHWKARCRSGCPWVNHDRQTHDVVVRLHRLTPEEMTFMVTESLHEHVKDWEGQTIQLKPGHTFACVVKDPTEHSYGMCNEEVTDMTDALRQKHDACVEFLLAPVFVIQEEGDDESRIQEYLQRQRERHVAARLLWEHPLADTNNLLREIFSFVCGSTYYG